MQPRGECPAKSIQLWELHSDPCFNTGLFSWIGGLCADYSMFGGKSACIQFLHVLHAKVIKLAFHSAERMRERRRTRSMGKDLSAPEPWGGADPTAALVIRYEHKPGLQKIINI